MDRRTDTTVQDARPWTVARDVLPEQRNPWRLGTLLRRRGSSGSRPVVAH
ncbi:MAG: hypothetical protein ABR549_05420 [Mycobacteriales bacterium]